MTIARRPSRPLAVVPVVLVAIAGATGLIGCSRQQDRPVVPLAGASSSSAPPSPSITPSPPSPPKQPVPITRPRPTTPRYVFPVQPLSHVRFGRAHHDYPATDIFARCGDSYRAVTSGQVVAVERVDRWQISINSGVTRGGLSVTLLGDDGVRYYGSHLLSVDPPVAIGRRVVVGQPLGRVGSTGSARGTGCHVHFGISPPCGSTDWFNRRGLVYPWPYLESWRAGGQLSPVAAVSAFRKTRGCPTAPLAYP